MIARALALLLVLGCTTSTAYAQQARPSAAGTRGRVLGTVIGAAAGFGAGLLIGLAAYDDAVNSERKIWTLTAVTTAAAAGAGYAIGAGLTRRAKSSPAAADRLAASHTSLAPGVRLRRPTTAPAPPFRTLFAPSSCPFSPARPQQFARARIFRTGSDHFRSE
jgi:hypothetical protein